MRTYFVIVLLFLIDISFFVLTDKAFICALLNIYLILLLHNPTVAIIGISLALLTLESHLYTGYAFLPLVYTIPITGIGIVTRSFIRPKILPAILLAIAAIIINQRLTSAYTLIPRPDHTYTFFMINANILLIILFFGIFRMQGKQGNRF